MQCRIILTTVAVVQHGYFRPVLFYVILFLRKTVKYIHSVLFKVSLQCKVISLGLAMMSHFLFYFMMVIVNQFDRFLNRFDVYFTLNPRFRNAFFCCCLDFTGV